MCKCDSFKSCFRKVSVGQYTTPLFYQGVDRVSSVQGGMLTILCALFLVTYTVLMVNKTFQRGTYYVDETARDN